MSTSPSPEPTKAVATQSKKRDLQAWLQSAQFHEAVKTALPTHLSAERFCRIALNALMRVPGLAKCSQASVFKCLLDLSALGLEPDGRRAHLIPFGNECTLIIDYKGLVELMLRGGHVSNIHADVVCEADEFEYDRGHVTKHKIDFRKPRGEMYAAYCIVTMKDGQQKTECLSKDEVNRIRERSKAKNNGPWVTDYNEMAKKTACRRVSKWVPLSPEDRDLIERDDQHQFRQETARVIESGVVDLGAFIPSGDENRGHDDTAAEAPGEAVVNASEQSAIISKADGRKLYEAGREVNLEPNQVDRICQQYGFQDAYHVRVANYDSMMAAIKAFK